MALDLLGWGWEEGVPVPLLFALESILSPFPALHHDRKPEPTQAMFPRLQVSWLLAGFNKWEAPV